MANPTALLHPALARAVTRYLRLADRLLPRRVVGLYIVGSSALGAFRPDRSDIDLIVVADGGLSPAELRRVRTLQIVSGAVTGARAMARGQLAGPGTCNATWVDAAELSRPVTAIRPLISHTGLEHNPGDAFDCNPVVWKVFAERGIAVRGAPVSDLELDPEPHLLRQWNLDNLDAYWRRWGEQAMKRRPPNSALAPARWQTAWGVLGAPRLHHTIATGEVISKEAAGEYALDVFDRRWHPIIRDGLAYWRGERPDPAFADKEIRRTTTGAFVLEVVVDAHRR